MVYDHPVSGNPVFFVHLLRGHRPSKPFLQWPLHVFVMTKLGGASSKTNHPARLSNVASTPRQVSHFESFFPCLDS